MIRFQKPSAWSMKAKLFGYMLLLAALILTAVLVGLNYSTGFTSVDNTFAWLVDIQLDVFEGGVASHFENVAAEGINLSEDISLFVEQYMSERGISFSDFEDSSEHIIHLQEELLPLLCQRIFQADCSGIFLMLDTTVNSTVENAELSRSGLYLQINGYNTLNKSLILYRGDSSVAKNMGIMPHRKWRLEFRTDLIPDYAGIVSGVGDSADSSYRFSTIFTLPGTSDSVMLLTVPILGSSGELYGFCGFEVSQSYFMAYHAQPTRLPHITCMLAGGTADSFSYSQTFSCGASSGYYRAPTGEFSLTSDKAGGLLCFKDDSVSYVGLKKTVSLSPNNDDFTFIVTAPRHDYDVHVGKSIAETLVLWLLLLFFTVNCCLFFSRRFLSPILKGIEALKSRDAESAGSRVPEIDDLFRFLADKDKEHDSQMSDISRDLTLAEEERERLRLEYDLARKRYEMAEAEIARLAYSRKKEVDPDDFARFLEGISTLTPTERKIFDYYLSGHTVNEIKEIASIKESTLRYHNQNIYGKLGVNSLKQLLRYAALMKDRSGN